MHANFNTEQNLADYCVLAPGPVNLDPSVRAALALPMIHHRTPEFDAVLKRVLLKLRQVFVTKQPCFILTSTGSGGMEALLVNLLNPGEKVLAIDSGKFGERWAEMAQIYGAEVIQHRVPWGQAVKVEDVAAILDQQKISLVLCQACETSTAVVHPIEALGKLISRYKDTLFLVDAITGLGAFPLPMDEWRLDGVVGGSQKAFMLPTGLSFVALSEKAWERATICKTPRFYFDLRKERAANERGETFFSSNVTLIRALDVVLDLIEAKGLRHLFDKIARRAEFTRQFGQRLGLQLYSQSPSNSVTALTVPAGVDSQKIRAHLEEKYRFTIMGGQDQAKGKIIRIGHMGHIEDSQMIALMLALREVLSEMNVKVDIDKDTLEREMKTFCGIN